MNSLGWGRREEEPVNTQPTGFLSSIQSYNPFQGSRGYVRLPTTEGGAGAPLPAPTRREEEEGWFVCKLISLMPSCSRWHPCSGTCASSLSSSICM
jgi:hypothetical protein